MVVVVDRHRRREGEMRGGAQTIVYSTEKQSAVTVNRSANMRVLSFRVHG